AEDQCRKDPAPRAAGRGAEEGGLTATSLIATSARVSRWRVRHSLKEPPCLASRCSPSRRSACPPPPVRTVPPPLPPSRPRQARSSSTPRPQRPASTT